MPGDPRKRAGHDHRSVFKDSAADTYYRRGDTCVNRPAGRSQIHIREGMRANETGYNLIMESELIEPAVKAALSTRWLGRTYRYFPEIPSTNTALKEMIAAGDAHDPPHGTVLLADYQSQGRGRLGRAWWASPGSSLLLSILFRPSWPAQRMQWLMMSASLAAADAIEATAGLRIGVKWPNDLVVEQDDAFHKVSGLLVDGDIGSKGIVHALILGIGINVNIPADDLPKTSTPSTSLMESIGQPVSRIALLVTFLQLLEEYYEASVRGHSPQPAWKQRLVTLGRAVRATVPGAALPIVGVAEDTDAWGSLQIRDEHGHLHSVSAGDVTLR